MEWLHYPPLAERSKKTPTKTHPSPVQKIGMLYVELVQVPSLRYFFNRYINSFSLYIHHILMLTNKIYLVDTL